MHTVYTPATILTICCNSTICLQDKLMRPETKVCHGLYVAVQYTVNKVHVTSLLFCTEIPKNSRDVTCTLLKAGVGLWRLVEVSPVNVACIELKPRSPGIESLQAAVRWCLVSEFWGGRAAVSLSSVPFLMVLVHNGDNSSLVSVHQASPGNHSDVQRLLNFSLL